MATLIGESGFRGDAGRTPAGLRKKFARIEKFNLKMLKFDGKFV
jgi:hypothetical protein